MYKPIPACFQDTHLTLASVSCLNYSWLLGSYHSTHTSYSCRVSVLIHRALAFRELSSRVVPDSSFVFLYCDLYAITTVLAFVFIPPPFSGAVIRELLSYLADKPDVLVFLLGDFNCYLDPMLDRHPPVLRPGGGGHTALGKLISEVG